MSANCPRCLAKIDPIFKGVISDVVTYEESLCTLCGCVTKSIYESGLLVAQDVYEFFRSGGRNEA